jgi:hypothetical protein
MDSKIRIFIRLRANMQVNVPRKGTAHDHSLGFLLGIHNGHIQEPGNQTNQNQKHGRPEKSVFAYGLEYLAFALVNSIQTIIQKLSTTFLSCTYKFFVL